MDQEQSNNNQQVGIHQAATRPRERRQEAKSRGKD